MNYAALNEAKQLIESINDNTNIIPILKKPKDRDFIRQYNLKIDDIKILAKQIPYNNFKSKIACTDKDIDADYLYDFKSVYYGTNEYGQSCTIPIYIKIGKDKLTNNTILVVSLHDDE